MTSRHFFHTGTREMLFDEPLGCPFYPPLSFLGVAVDDTDRQHLILTVPSARFYAGPDLATVRRRAHILADALETGRPRLNSDLAAGVDAWIGECWESLLDELVDAWAAPLTRL